MAAKLMVNLNSPNPQIIVSVLMKAVERFPDSTENRRLAIKLAERLWLQDGNPVEVACWQAGHGQLIFKRTDGHCFGGTK